MAYLMNDIATVERLSRRRNKALYTCTNLRPPIKINFRWLNVKNK